jgi:predicted dehydrogenase
MEKKVRIGIIGSGSNATRHAAAYKKMDDVELVAVADLVPGKAAEFIRQQGLTQARPFESHKALLELDLDGVSICTPNIAHHETSVDALNAGKHVLTEKPMAVTLEQAVDMVKAARRAGKILTVGFQPRYDPNIQEIKRTCNPAFWGKCITCRRAAAAGAGCRGEDLSAKTFPVRARSRISAAIRSIWRWTRSVIRSR